MNNTHMKILYRLTTKDGIKSDIREADQFMPTLSFAPKSNLEVMSWGEHVGAVPTIESRRYRVKTHCTVVFVEYEEVKG